MIREHTRLLVIRPRVGEFFIEALVAAAIIGILAAIALPAYSSFVTSSRAKGAAADLLALALVYENDFQKQLAYPTYDSAAIPALPAARTSPMSADFGAWTPAQSDGYTYSTTSTTSTYRLTATASTGDCVLTLSNVNGRTASGAKCGFTSW
jgi:type IV pilus assembly protein PilE